MSAMDEFEKKYFEPLREEAYFVSVFGPGPEPFTLIIDCSVYLNDVDWAGGSTGVVRVGRHDPLREDDKCVGCSAKTNETREWKRGSIICPLCSTWSAPWSLRQRPYRGIFRLEPGKPGKLVPELMTDLEQPKMTNDHMVKTISDALRQASLYCLSEEMVEAAGWTPGSLLRACIVCEEEFRIRAEEAAEESANIREAEEWQTSHSTLQAVYQKYLGGTAT